LTVPAGHAGAQFQLGIMYGSGLGMTEDAALSTAWYCRAAEQGPAEAQTALGDLYAKGIGVAADPGAAREWYEKAAARPCSGASKAGSAARPADHRDRPAVSDAHD
jgi:TPR repeat protein